MFDIGWAELLVVAVVAILVVGPKELPGMLRSFGKTVGNLRRMASEFQGQFSEALREAETQAGVDDMKKSMSGMSDLNPMKDFKNSINPLNDIGKDINSALKSTPAAPGAPQPDKTAAPPTQTGASAAASETPAATPATENSAAAVEQPAVAVDDALKDAQKNEMQKAEKA